VETDIHAGTVGLLSLDALNVDGELFTVDLDNFADLLPLEVTTENLDFVILVDGHGPNSIFCSDFFDRGEDMNFLPMWEGAEK
jgi:hypothetical protein